MELRIVPRTLKLAETFTIAYASSDEELVVGVELHHGGLVGYGEATPFDRYDETARDGLDWLERAARAARRRPLRARGDRGAPRGDPGPAGRRGPRSTRALHDLVGKLCGQPTWRLLGLSQQHARDDVHDRDRHDRGHGRPRAPRGRGRLPAAQDQGRRRGRPAAAAGRQARHATCPCASTRTRAGTSSRRTRSCRSCSTWASSWSSSRSRPDDLDASASCARFAHGIPIVIDEGCHTLRDVARDRDATPTASTSSSPRAAASARRCAWSRPPARSAWSS